MYKVGISNIHGMGLTATTVIGAGTLICTATKWQNNLPGITEAGKYVNHSYQPNSKLVRRDYEYDLVATKQISVGEEITADYTFTPWFLEKPREDFI